MRRRELVGLGTLGLAAACVDLPFARSGSADELARALEHLDAIVAALKASQPDDPKLAEHHTSFTSSLATMCAIGTLRASPGDPRIAHRLAGIGKDTLAARDRLRETSAELRKRIDQELRKDPEMVARVLDRIDRQSEEYGVPAEHRAHLRTAAAHVAWRFRSQGSTAVIDELTSKLDRGFAPHLVGMPIDPPEERTEGGRVVRARAATRASVAEIKRVICMLGARGVVDGQMRTIDLRWRGEACTGTPEPDAVSGKVDVEELEDGNVIVVELELPSATPNTEGLEEIARNIVLELRRRAEPQPKPEHLGRHGDACTWNGDCEEKCLDGRCAAVMEGFTWKTSAKVLHDTEKVAKMGGILLIPPICFVGILVLLACGIVAIVAGLIALGGD